VHVVSARAVPRADACRAAAGQIGGTVGWVTGRTCGFNPVEFASDRRDVVSSRLRHRARQAGLDLWEPDATIIRTDLLRDHPIRPGLPWGSWLRSVAATGVRGTTTERTLALRAAPTDAESYWPDVIARQRAAAADLARATARGRPDERLLAALLLARELYAVSILGWLSLPVLLGASGEFPFELDPVPATLLAAVLVYLRWASSRSALRLELAARSDLLAAVHHVPGSLASIPAALGAHIRPMRATIPTRPLVWAALFLALLCGATIIGRDPHAPVSKAAMGTSLVTLGLLWAFTMRSLVQQSWRRTTFRIPVTLPAIVDGHEAEVEDASPSGIAVRCPAGQERRAAGDRIDVTIRLDDGSIVGTVAQVGHRRRSADHDILGLRLDLGPADRQRWLGQLLLSADVNLRTPTDRRRSSAGTEPGPRRASVDTVLDRGTALLSVTVSLALATLLVLVALGFQPMIIRSGSMVPTYGVGDIVLSEGIRAADLRVGDVVTAPPDRPGAETITHRVRSLEHSGDQLVVESRGDANTASETWTVTEERLVGRVRWSVPWVGQVASGFRSSGVQLGVGLVALGLVAAAMVRPARRHRAAGGSDRPDG
jgi:signal peptidase I